MNPRHILVALTVLALAGLLGWHLSHPRGSAIVVRYLEPPARGKGPLGLVSCAVRVEDANGVVLASRKVAAKSAGRAVRAIRLPMKSSEIERAERVIADCTDVAGRTSEPTIHALDGNRTIHGPLTARSLTDSDATLRPSK